MSHAAGTIVVGVDGSTSSAKALDWAVDQAVAEHRALSLVHASGTVTPAYHDAAIISPRDVEHALHEQGEQVLAEAREAAARRAPDLEVDTTFEIADPRDVLLRRSRDAAMVVLGSRGRGHLRSLLLGSVGVALARHASCPVVIHRPSRGDHARRGILVAADAREESQPALEFAYRQAELTGLPLTVAHCYWDVYAATTRAQLVDERTTDVEQERLALAEALAGMREKYPDVHVHSELVRGLPEQALADIGERMDLVVVGAHQGSRGQQFMFGSVSVTVVEHATGPVAVVPLDRD